MDKVQDLVYHSLAMPELIYCDFTSTPVSRQKFRDNLFDMRTKVPKSGDVAAWAVIEIRHSADGEEISIVQIHRSREAAYEQERETRNGQLAIVEKFGGVRLDPVRAFGRDLPTYWFEKQKTIFSFDVFVIKTSLVE